VENGLTNKNPIMMEYFMELGMGGKIRQMPESCLTLIVHEEFTEE
jgi:hypothetical protein